MTRQQQIGLVTLTVLLAVGLLGVRAASKWLSSDARDIRQCEPTYWTCSSEVVALPRLKALEGRVPTFEGVAGSCARYRAWERAVHRAMFDCQVSALVETGSCEERETVCELMGGG